MSSGVALQSQRDCPGEVGIPDLEVAGLRMRLLLGPAVGTNHGHASRRALDHRPTRGLHQVDKLWLAEDTEGVGPRETAQPHMAEAKLDEARSAFVDQLLSVKVRDKVASLWSAQIEPEPDTMPLPAQHQFCQRALVVQDWRKQPPEVLVGRLELATLRAASVPVLVERWS